MQQVLKSRFLGLLNVLKCLKCVFLMSRKVMNELWEKQSGSFA